VKEGCGFVPEEPNEGSDSVEVAEVLAGTSWIACKTLELSPAGRIRLLPQSGYAEQPRASVLGYA
jgi:hypothetical protein